MKQSFEYSIIFWYDLARFSRKKSDISEYLDSHCSIALAYSTIYVVIPDKILCNINTKIFDAGSLSTI